MEKLMIARTLYLVNNMANTFLVDNCTFNGCNKSCRYCRAHKKTKGSEEAVEKSLSLLETYVNATILKISGYGEITLARNWKQLVGRHDWPYEKVQVITNATLLSEGDIDWLASRGYSLCVSLDGNTSSSNAARSSSSAEVTRIIKNLTYASSLGIPIEINTVLTQFNINQLEPFLDFVESLNCVCYPFPVRENRLYGRGKSLKPSKKDAEKSIGRLIDGFSSFCRSLPPKVYLESLMQFMLEGERGICHVPETIMGISPESDLLKCPCSGTQKIANILSGGKEAFDRYFAQRSSGGYDKECKDCFTHYEVMNLFLENKITEIEMNQLPLFRNLNLVAMKSA